MSAPRLIACYFAGDSRFARLANVLRYSAARYCPGWDLQIEEITPAALERHQTANQSHLFNTQKMEAWYHAVDASPDDTQILILDADTAIVQPLDDVWDWDFEFAYTAKDSRFPFNSGVAFLRLTPAVRVFMKVWRDRNLEMLSSEPFHQHWRRQYGGINQASLGFALDSGEGAQVNIVGLSCVEWNCEDSSWRQFDPAITRIVHYKSALRQALFGECRPRREHVPLIQLWQALEAEALATV